MGGQQGWLKAHEISPEQTSMIEAAIGRITLRLIREAEPGTPPFRRHPPRPRK
jgi:hypothetical protein